MQHLEALVMMRGLEPKYRLVYYAEDSIAKDFVFLDLLTGDFEQLSRFKT